MRPAGTPAASNRSSHSRGRAHGHDLVQEGNEHVTVLDAFGHGVVQGISGQVWPLEGRAAPLPQRVVGHTEGDEAVGRGEDLVGNDRGMSVAAASRPLARREIDSRLVREQRGHRVEHRDLDLLAAPGATARQEGKHDAVGRRHTRHQIRDRRPHLHRRPVGKARDVHEARFGLNHEIVAGASGLRPRFAEAGDRAVHELGILVGEGGVAEAELLHGARPEILEEHVTLPDQGAQDRLSLGVLEVEGDALLVAIDRHEVGGFAAHERRPASGVVPLAGFLDLDDLGTHVPEHHRAERPGQHASEIEHANARQGAARKGSAYQPSARDFPFQARLAQLRAMALTRSPARPARRQKRRARSSAPSCAK